ncbi:hypothetical protein O5282_27010 [Escherichia coli]|nr:hypothetical protein [Escherichia coli]
MKDNPVVALTRVPGLMSGLGNISGALGKVFRRLTHSLNPCPMPSVWPEQPAKQPRMYSRHSCAEWCGQKKYCRCALDTVSGQLNAAPLAFNRMSPGLSAMAPEY